ncbi:MAG: hypothetical protein K0S08_39 [Gammaproteobacteria bacterium]|jgi:hypothetical protein|nr:hypothetical protein [Gammaproteobacteria bacterium]
MIKNTQHEKTPLKSFPQGAISEEEYIRWSKIKNASSAAVAIVSGFFAQYGADVLEDWLNAQYQMDAVQWKLLTSLAKGFVTGGVAIGLAEGLNKLLDCYKRRNFSRIDPRESSCTRIAVGSTVAPAMGAAVEVGLESLQHFALGLTQLSPSLEWAAAAIKGPLTALTSLGIFRATQHCCVEKSLQFSGIFIEETADERYVIDHTSSGIKVARPLPRPRNP